MFFPMVTSVAQARFNDGAGLWGSVGPLRLQISGSILLGNDCRCFSFRVLRFQLGDLALLVKSIEDGYIFGEFV